MLSAERAARSPAAVHYATEAFAPLREALAAHAPAHGLRLDHPYFARVRPVTLRIEEVEAIWAPIAERDDWSLLYATLDAIAEMADAAGTIPASRGTAPTAAAG
jgi:hypothetical protein